MTGYRAKDVSLDGRTIEIRAIRPSDKQALEEGLEHLSPQSAYFRFFQHKTRFSLEELAYFTEIDFINHVALVAVLTKEGSEVAVGVGRYIVLDNVTESKVVEIAFAVLDDYHGLGIATLLFKHLTAIARKNSIEVFQADVLVSNKDMLEVFEHTGLSLEENRLGDVIEVSLHLY